jgi:hypothetical protein
MAEIRGEEVHHRACRRNNMLEINAVKTLIIKMDEATAYVILNALQQTLIARGDTIDSDLRFVVEQFDGVLRNKFPKFKGD